MLVFRLVPIHERVCAIILDARQVCALVGLAVLVLAVSEREAHAQIHGDVGVNVGLMDRVRHGGKGNGEFGPLGELEGHIAVLPLLRVGAYVSHDIAPNSIDGSAWQVTSVGVHAKVIAPFVRGAYRAWFFTGFGFAGVYAPSYNITFDFQDGQGPRNSQVTGAGGSFFEIPVGIGFGWKFSKPWELVAQLGTRINFNFVGSIYDTDNGRYVIPDGGPEYYFAVPGDDTFAPFLTVGIALDP
ncbi:MAG: hypothetical protein ACRELY_06150 [Polyangiaceae bacterium]